MDKYAYTIQTKWKKYRNNIHSKILSIISILNLNNKLMKDIFFKIKKISLLFPPAKNENKFIYGKLIENVLIKVFNKIGFKCNNLDNDHYVGSEYKFDIKLLNIFISIKAKLNKNSDTILINKLSSNCHKLNMVLMCCCIKESKLYIVPSFIVNKEYIKNKPGSIEYKGKLYTFLKKYHKEYIYDFPELDTLQQDSLSNITEINIYKDLYNQYIK